MLDPEALTIGFARRFATYKRATLMFRDLARLKRILTNPRMPVQIVIAGKAHPLDVPGKTLIREIVQYSRDPELARRVVFVEDYGIQVARELVQGVDVWLNTPRRGEEACGTSGMKAGINGVSEHEHPGRLVRRSGRAVRRLGRSATASRIRRTATTPTRPAIYSLLENEIVPLYYEDREQGVPVEWMRRVKQSLRYVSANFNCQRMVSEYRSQLYEPAHRASGGHAETRFRRPRDRVPVGIARWPRSGRRCGFVECGRGDRRRRC